MGGAINWRQSPPKARRQTAARRESILGASLFACLDSRDQAGRWHARCCCPAHSADACEVASVVEASVTAVPSRLAGCLCCGILHLSNRVGRVASRCCGGGAGDGGATMT